MTDRIRLTEENRRWWTAAGAVAVTLRPC